MDWHKLEGLLAPVYNQRGPADSWAQIERLSRLAQQLCAQLGDEAEEVDRDMLTALSYLVTLGDEVPRNLGLRGNIEAYLVQEGWTPLKVRMLIRSLETLTTKPETIEAKLAVDAYSLGRTGMLGFARHIQRGTTAGQSLEECLRVSQSCLRERLYTKPAQVAANDRRTALRQLIGQLQKALD